MLFSATAQLGMIATALLGTLLLGFSMRRRQTWTTLLIWIVPICVILPATDQLLNALSTPFPSLTMDGGLGDSLRFGLCFLALAFPCEIICQLAVSAIADRFTSRIPARNHAEPTPAPVPAAATEQKAEGT